MKELLAEQYDFFDQIASLAFVNPFSERRDQADCKLLNIAVNSHTIFQRSEKIQELLGVKLQQIQPLTDFNITQFRGKQKHIMKYSWLFYQFMSFNNYLLSLLTISG